MIKIALDSAAHQTERHANSPLDLTRRLAWRLEWEKAQVDNWQASSHASSHAGGQQVDSTESSIATAEESLGERDEAFARTRPASDRFPVAMETGQIGGPDMHRSAQGCDSFGPTQARLSNGQTAIAPSGVESAVRPPLINPKTVQTVRAMPMPLNRPPLPAAVHIYQADGKVEVALRNTGLNAKDGLNLMTELKRDLASLGLRLARLTLNGELLWQTDTSMPNGLAFSDTDGDEAPIDKIY